MDHLVRSRLFLLGLPNKLPPVIAVDDVEARKQVLAQDAAMWTGVVRMDQWSEIAWLAKRADDVSLSGAKPIPTTIRGGSMNRGRFGLAGRFQNKGRLGRGQYVPDSAIRVHAGPDAGELLRRRRLTGGSRSFAIAHQDVRIRAGSR